jgi:hypothetical protein
MATFTEFGIDLPLAPSAKSGTHASAAEHHGAQAMTPA